MLDGPTCDQITRLVETLSTSGKMDQVDKKDFVKLVRVAGQSESYIKFLTERIFQQLEQKHSEIRLGTFLIVKELFRRSEYFRDVLLNGENNWNNFLELTVETNPDNLLPPPIPAAKTLKARVLQSIHKWNMEFGKDQTRLPLTVNFLKNNLKVDFQDALQRNENELRSVRLEEERRKKMLEKKIHSVQVEIGEHREEIMRVVEEMDNCFKLLIPKEEELFVETTTTTKEDEDDIDMREHGMFAGSCSTSIAVHLDDVERVTVTEDNSAIVDMLKDFYKLLSIRYLPLIRKWAKVASAAEATSSFIKEILELKSHVEKEIHRYQKIKGFDSKETEESESDSEFEEVPEKEGYEEKAVSQPVLPLPAGPSTTTCKSAEASTSTPVPSTSTSSRGWSLCDVRREDVDDPTTLSATLKSLSKRRTEKEQQSKLGTPVDIGSSSKSVATVPESRKDKLLKIAPKLPYDIDLYHWEDKDLKAPSVEIVETDGHKFWTPSQDRAGEVIDDPNGIESLRSRVIEFSGKFEPVKWSCRVPLSNGTLCPRRDRKKCPFHGKIIARDEAGSPINEEDKAELEKQAEEEEKSKVPEWQDPVFLKEIEAATGMDLTIHPSSKGKRQKRKKTFAQQYPQLTDISKKGNTPRGRLEKIVFNKSTMKRVAQTLEAQSSKKFEDKFGDQWNYAMNTNE